MVQHNLSEWAFIAPTFTLRCTELLYWDIGHFTKYSNSWLRAGYAYLDDPLCLLPGHFDNSCNDLHHVHGQLASSLNIIIIIICPYFIPISIKTYHAVCVITTITWAWAIPHGFISATHHPDSTHNTVTHLNLLSNTPGSINSFLIHTTVYG